MNGKEAKKIRKLYVRDTDRIFNQFLIFIHELSFWKRAKLAWKILTNTFGGF